MNREKIKSLCFRFLRGGTAGAVSVMVTVVGAGVNEDGIKSLADLQLWAVSLTLAGISGFVSGLILTIDKYFRLE